MSTDARLLSGQSLAGQVSASAPNLALLESQLRLIPAGAVASAATGSPVADSTDMPATALPLILRGLVAGANSRTGMAIIETDGQQDFYRSGDAIINTSNVIVNKVFTDSVELLNSGRAERLWLDNQQESSVLFNGEEELEGDVRPVAPEMSAPPQALSAFGEFEPQFSDGVLSGWRISRLNSSLDGPAGEFQLGDVIIAVNGRQVNNASDASGLADLITRNPTDGVVDFDILRNGAAHSIRVSTRDLLNVF